MLMRFKQLLIGTLRRQLTYGVALLLALTLTLLVWDMSRRQQEMVMAQQADQALALTRSVATSSEVWLASRDFSGLQEIIMGLAPYPDLHYAMVLDSSGQVLAHSDPSRRGLYLGDLPQDTKTSARSMGASLFDITYPITLANTHIGWVRLGLGREALNAKLAQMRRNGIFYSLLATALGSLLAALAGRYMTRRLDAIQSVAEAVRTGSTALRVMLPGDDEAARLAHEFNAMLDTLAQRETSLKVSSDLFRAVFDKAAIGLAQISISGQFLQINQAFCRIIGYGAEEVTTHGFAFQSITFAEDLAADLAYIDQLLRGDVDNYTLEKRYIRKDGSIVWVNLLVQLLRDEVGAPLYFITAVQDISERKQSELKFQQLQNELEERVRVRTADLAATNEALQRTRQLADEANIAKSAFLANMSHEIRTPLNAIIGLNFLLRRDGATPQQVIRLNQVDSAGRHLLSIINDILDISKIEAGRMQLESSNFHLSSILDNVASIFGEPTRSKGLQISIDADDVPLWLRGDPMRLRQALINYVGNAIKFTEQGGIALRAKLLQDRDGELLIRFEVADTGIGIAADKLGRLFNAFEQVDASTTRKYGGTGLGLTITRRLAQLMGGEVGVESQLGVGSTFWFTAHLQRGNGIMFAVSSTDQEDTENQLRSRHRGARLLLAEDNAINREVATEMLNGVGLSVDTATDGREALQKAQTQAYDLILMDLQMPRMDGLEATMAIRALPGWEHKPIIAMTANAFEEDRRACEAVGMSDFVSKPVDPGLLFRTLLKWLPPAALTVPKVAGFLPETVVTNASAQVPDAALEHTLARLANVPGLNLTYGLKVLRGNAGKYLRLLAQFMASHSGDMTRLAESLADGDHPQALLLTHSLKGAAATLGLEQLALLAGRLDKTLHTNLSQGTVVFNEEFRTDVEAIKLEFTQLASVLPPPSVVAPATTPIPIDPSALQALLTQLDAMLALGDAAVIALFEDHGAELQTALGPRCKELAQQIKKFDFDVARATLHTLR